MVGVKKKTSKKSKPKKTKKVERPFLISFLSILLYVLAALGIFVGVIIAAIGFLGESAFNEALKEEQFQNITAQEMVDIDILISILPWLIPIGIFIIILSIIHVFIGVGFWRGRTWSWIVAIVLLSIHIISGIVFLAMAFDSSSLFTTLLEVVILLYLTLDPRVRAHFGQK